MRFIKNYSLSILSIFSINIFSLIEHFNLILNIFIFLIQLTIGILTILKVFQDVKTKHFKNLEISEDETKKQHPILFYLFNFFKRKE